MNLEEMKRYNFPQEEMIKQLESRIAKLEEQAKALRKQGSIERYINSLDKDCEAFMSNQRTWNEHIEKRFKSLEDLVELVKTDIRPLNIDSSGQEKHSTELLGEYRYQEQEIITIPELEMIKQKMIKTCKYYHPSCDVCSLRWECDNIFSVYEWDEEGK